MSKLFHFFAVLLVWCSVQSGVAAEGKKTQLAPDIQRIIDRGTLIVAMVSKDHPPFFMKDARTGQMAGLDVELAEGIAKELGVKVEYNRKAKTFNELVEIVGRGEADLVISKLSLTLTRSKKVLYSQPYIVLRKGLLLNRLDFTKRKGRRNTAEFIQHLHGRIGVIKGSSYEESAKKMFPNAEVVPMPTWEDVLKAVVAGKLTAAFRDELEVKKFLRQHPNAAIKLESVVFKDTQDPIAIAIRYDCPHLQFWVNQYLTAVQLNMNADRLLERYKAKLTNGSEKKETKK